MVFPFPVYLDHPNLPQLQHPVNLHGNPSLDNPQLPTPLLPPTTHVGGGPSSIRPGSMVDRAWMAKIPLPEAGLKCPRCDSTNTKFCYFNNYNLSQPRHFCKTCRRYWTRGGALRNVPVGGGCRRNKRSSNKSTNSNKLKSGGGGQVGNSTPTISSLSPPSPYQLSQSSAQKTPLMAAFQNLTNYGGYQPQLVGNSNGAMGFHVKSDDTNLPVNLEQPSIFYHFHGESSNGIEAAVKTEDHRQGGMNSSTKQFLEMNQYWGSVANSWTGFSGLNSSTTSHLL